MLILLVFMMAGFCQKPGFLFDELYFCSAIPYGIAALHEFLSLGGGGFISIVGGN